MTHNATAPVDAEQSKLAAHAIKKRFDELNSPIKLNHAYEALAIAHRYPNWATMKASFGSNAISKRASKRTFALGSPYGRENVLLERTITEALRHFHAFGPSEASRTRLLVALSRNAIENDAGLIFCQTVTPDSDRSETMLSIMDKAVKEGRRQDFFVLDASDLKTRLGNTFNILEYVASGEEAAELIFGLKLPSEAYGPPWVGYAITATAAQWVLDGPERLTADALQRIILKMGTGDMPLSEEQIASCTYERGGRIDSDICKKMAEHVASVTKRNPRIFDGASQWSGLLKAFSRKEIVVVFLADDGGDTEVLMSQIIIGAMKRAIRTAPLTLEFPNMAVFNDVTDVALDAAVVEESVARGVVIAVGDQCPTPPAAFRGKATQFRCREKSHYLETDEGELAVWADHRPN